MFNHDKNNQWLREFVKESNYIEGIIRDETLAEVNALGDFLELKEVTIEELSRLVTVFTESPDGGGIGHRLRSKYGLDVMIGGRTAPLGGPDLVFQLKDIIKYVNTRKSPYEGHLMYEHLHPYTDGNGRSGRALWLWHMKRLSRLEEVKAFGFLHLWYYETLRESI